MVGVQSTDHRATYQWCERPTCSLSHDSGPAPKTARGTGRENNAFFGPGSTRRRQLRKGFAARAFETCKRLLVVGYTYSRAAAAAGPWATIAGAIR